MTKQTKELSYSHSSNGLWAITDRLRKEHGRYALAEAIERITEVANEDYADIHITLTDSEVRIIIGPQIKEATDE